MGADSRPKGLSLLELLIAISITSMVVVTLAALAKSVQVGTEYSEGHGSATHHARVVVDRITRTAREAHASRLFPGFIVLAEDVLSWNFPDTLVVWHPAGDPADPDGLPRFDELVVYCPHPKSPNRLIELTSPTDLRTVPPVADGAAWRSEIDAMKSSQASLRVELTDLVRTAVVGELIDTPLRAAVRFQHRLRPSEEEWVRYRSGTLGWHDLPWVQGIYGSETGLRQAWLSMELQFVPRTSVGGSPGGSQSIPFFGSAALYYEMHR
jgi:hypothetical protein